MLKHFFEWWLAEVDLQHHYVQTHGLCPCLRYWWDRYSNLSTSEYFALSAQLNSALDKEYGTHDFPFGGAIQYRKDNLSTMMHLNPERRHFVRKQLYG